MLKKRISGKRGLKLQDIPIVNIEKSKIKDFKEVDPADFFRDQQKIGAALLQALIENDTEAFIEILDEYLRVNRSDIAKKAKIGRSTIQEVFSQKGNPTLKTLAKIVHYSVLDNQNKIFKR